MLPVLFRIGPLHVSAYSTMIALGFMFGMTYSMHAARRSYAVKSAVGTSRITPDHVFSACRGGLFVGVLGTRVLYVALNWRYYSAAPGEIVQFWHGGLSSLGAPLFVFPYFWLYCRRHRLSFPKFADIVAPGFALCQAIGRIGCFLGGCCYGHGCSLPWAVQFHLIGAPGLLTPPRHPAQLYESALNFVGFAILARLLAKPHRDGEVVLGWIGLYGVVRFTVELFRIGATSEIVACGLSVVQLLCLITATLAAAQIRKIRRRETNGAQIRSLGFLPPIEFERIHT